MIYSFAAKMHLLHVKGFENLGSLELVAVSEMAGYFTDFYSDCCLGSKGPHLKNKSTVQTWGRHDFIWEDWSGFTFSNTIPPFL